MVDVFLDWAVVIVEKVPEEEETHSSVLPGIPFH